MLAELQNSIGNDVLTGLAHAVGAIALCAVVVALCGWQSIHVEREAAVSMARGLVQMVLVGVVLALLLHGSLLIGSLILFMMTIAAAVTAARRLKGMDGALLLCFWSIATGAGIIIAVMHATGSLRSEISMLGLVWIPGVMAGMVVSGASPVYAGIYQFVVVAMILAASGITGLVATVLMRSRAFSPAAQLTLRPAEAPASSRQSAPLK
jgi:ABC-type iron transport system FetAB permease component